MIVLVVIYMELKNTGHKIFAIGYNMI
jgi:hypothetical protein